MLSVVKKEDLTRELVLENNEISELRTLHLPDDWWQTTVSHDVKRAKKDLKILKFNHHPTERRKAPLFPNIDYWDLKKGDYKINDACANSIKKSTEYKKILTFAHFSIAIVLTVASVAFILSLIVRM